MIEKENLNCPHISRNLHSALKSETQPTNSLHWSGERDSKNRCHSVGSCFQWSDVKNSTRYAFISQWFSLINCTRPRERFFAFSASNGGQATCISMKIYRVRKHKLEYHIYRRIVLRSLVKLEKNEFFRLKCHKIPFSEKFEMLGRQFAQFH